MLCVTGTDYKVITEKEDVVEVSFSRTWSPGQPNTVVPLNVDMRFNYMAITDEIQLVMPTEADRQAGKPLAYKEAVKLTNPVSNPAFKDQVDDKYEYTLEKTELKLKGWVSDSAKIGFWVIAPSDEYMNGGPKKNDLTCHCGPTVVVIFTSIHTFGLDLLTEYRNGEPWKKAFGPILVYLNSDADHSALWKDAKSQGYNFWTQTDDKGNFVIKNVRPGDYNLYGYVIGVVSSFRHPQLITVKAGDELKLGQVAFKPPRTGPTVWEIGIPDRSANEFFVPDADPNFVNKFWLDKPKDKYRQYGLWLQYPVVYPKDDVVFQVGVSNYSKDWFFAHVLRGDGKTYNPTIWKVIFDLPEVSPTGNYTIQIALAAAEMTNTYVYVNDVNAKRPHYATGTCGTDNAIARHGNHGLYRFFSGGLPSNLFIKGKNTIFMRQARSSNYAFSGVMPKMKLKVIESSIICPLEKTKSSHRLWLSNLDLVHGRIHLPLLYFYKAVENGRFFEAGLLKETLRRVLVLFYPIAGRLARDEMGRLEVDCNGEGVLFVEAETDFRLSQIGESAPSFELLKLVPRVDYSQEISSYPLLLLQVTRFKCGGASLGVGIHHSLVDGVSTTSFINTWSNMARGLPPTVLPFLDRTFLRARNPPSPKFHHPEYDSPPTLIKNPVQRPNQAPKPTSTTIIKFTPTQLSILRAKAANPNNNVRYTTNQILMAHIWRCASQARGLADNQPTRLNMPVDGRSRLKPPVPSGYFGSMIFNTTIVAMVGELISEPMARTVSRIHRAVEKMNDEYLRSAIDYLENPPDPSGVARVPGSCKSPNLTIASWTRIPFHSADFGLGSPILTRAANLFEGKGNILPMNEDGSISLVICLESDAMVAFQKLVLSAACCL
ncbi:Shikimate O-hydroxycinnamoyltransferase [Linum perenne]